MFAKYILDKIWTKATGLSRRIYTLMRSGSSSSNIIYNNIDWQFRFLELRRFLAIIGIFTIAFCLEAKDVYYKSVTTWRKLDLRLGRIHNTAAKWRDAHKFWNLLREASAHQLNRVEVKYMGRVRKPLEEQCFSLSFLLSSIRWFNMPFRVMRPLLNVLYNRETFSRSFFFQNFSTKLYVRRKTEFTEVFTRNNYRIMS